MALNGFQTAGRWSRCDFNLGAVADRLFATRGAQLGWFFAMSLLTRFSVFGDPNYHNDELLFFLIGQRMHEGLLPYVDIWDRKGPGLFLVYFLIAGLSHAVVAYQAVAAVFAALTALVVNIIAERFAGRLGAVLAGTLYLLGLTLFAGSGGQAPVFYNLFMALAALAIVSSFQELQAGKLPTRVLLGMGSAGFALTFKQTAVFESLFFGCVSLWQLARSGVPLPRLARLGIGLAAAGAAPFAIFTVGFASIGHIAEFWHAMVTANLTKTYNPGSDAWIRIRALALIGSPVIVPAALSLLGGRAASQPAPRAFLAGWISAALIGLAIIPNFIDHYALPVLLPLAVTAAPALERRGVGPAFALVATVFALVAGPAFKFSERQASRAAIESLVSDIRARDPHPRLFVYQGPPYLYALLGSYPPTPLIFPVHLFHLPERNTSHLDTVAEVRKILAWNPTVVITAHDDLGDLVNRETEAPVEWYKSGCRFWFTRTIIDMYGPQKIDVYGNCLSRKARPHNALHASDRLDGPWHVHRPTEIATPH